MTVEDLTNGGNISGATTDTLVISPATFSDIGLYDVIVSNGCGSATSNSVTLTQAVRLDFGL